jgi:hypothetical protein
VSELSVQYPLVKYCRYCSTSVDLKTGTADTAVPMQIIPMQISKQALEAHGV